MASQEQREFIAYLIDKKKDGHIYFTQLINETPKNNKKYPDTRADYSRMILADRLVNLTESQADYIIKAYNGKYGYHVSKARQILESRITRIKPFDHFISHRNVEISGAINKGDYSTRTLI